MLTGIFNMSYKIILKSKRINTKFGKAVTCGEEAVEKRDTEDFQTTDNVLFLKL